MAREGGEGARAMERDDPRCAVLSIASPHPPLVLRNNKQLMMATEEDKTGNGEPRCGVMRKMPGEGGATMHHRHIHNNAPQAHPRQEEAYNGDNENNNNKD